jgi:hypothetical protein
MCNLTSITSHGMGRKVLTKTTAIKVSNLFSNGRLPEFKGHTVPLTDFVSMGRRTNGTSTACFLFGSPGAVKSFYQEYVKAS